MYFYEPELIILFLYFCNINTFFLIDKISLIFLL